jgi:hypothetical protein
MWDLWWTKWHWDRFFSEYFGFALSISFHRCSITTKMTKKIIIFTVIFITGLYKKPQGCGASVASVVRLFTTKKKSLLVPTRNYFAGQAGIYPHIL